VQACSIPNAHEAMASCHALSKAWTSAEEPIFPPTRLQHPAPDGERSVSGVLQVLPGKVAGIWATNVVINPEESLFIFRTRHVVMNTCTHLDDEWAYRLVRQVRVDESGQQILAVLTWTDRDRLELKLLRGELVRGAYCKWEFINNTLLPLGYQKSFPLTNWWAEQLRKQQDELEWTRSVSICMDPFNDDRRGDSGDNDEAASDDEATRAAVGGGGGGDEVPRARD